MKVRQALSADFRSVDDLLETVYVGEGYTSADRGGALRSVADRSQACTIMVATNDDGVVVGTVTLITSQNSYAQIRGETEAEVRLLAVSPEARGGGAGAALMHCCMERSKAAGFERLVLSTQTTMVAAHRLYERLEFAREESRDWQRASGRRMLVYVLQLA